MRTETLNAANESETRSLSVDEIEAISGGVIEGGCIVYPLPFPIEPSPTFPTDPVTW